MPLVPRCPACAYDLSGIAESWREACPLRGVCPECGGSLDWRALLTRPDQPPPWSFEHARSPGVRPAIVTLLRLAEPMSFFSAMRGARSAHPRRVALLVGAVALCGLVLAALGALWTADALAPGPGSARPWRPFSARSLLADSYGAHSREAVIYLLVWLLGSVAGTLPFARRGSPFAPHAAAAALYACVCLVLLWTALALAAMADVYQYLRFGVVESDSEVVAVVCIGASWMWIVLMWAGAVRWRLPVRRRAAAWLVSQGSAATAVALFGAIDPFLPF